MPGIVSAFSSYPVCQEVVLFFHIPKAKRSMDSLSTPLAIITPSHLVCSRRLLFPGSHISVSDHRMKLASLH